MKNQKGFTIIELLVFLIIPFLAFGWGWNIVKIAGSSFNDVTGMLVLRIIGVFMAPLGAVLGYF